MAHHDETLREITTEINSILDEVESHGPRLRKLCFIEFQGQLMLAWSLNRYGLGMDDDPREVAKALGLRTDDPDYPHTDDRYV